MDTRERLERLLGGSELQSLRARLRGWFERGGETGTLTLPGLNGIEREALARLLGRRAGTGASMRVEVGALDEVLQRAEVAGSLRAALEMLDGPIVDRRAARAAAVNQWQSEQDTAMRLGDRRLTQLLGQPRGLGLLKRVSGSDAVLAGRLWRQANLVLERLPAGTVTRAQLAADLLGNAHALDPGQPVAALVLAALRTQPLEDATVAEAEDSDRSVWAAAGVLVNELARPAMFLNLPAAHGIVGAPGEPSYLSLRALLRTSIRWQVRGRSVFVCENPNMVAIAADSLGKQAAPLVCTDGMPAAAQRTLLNQLRAGGALLRYHGDFDWAGIAIGNVMMARFGATPWRFFSDDYVAAVRHAPVAGSPLGEGNREAVWDTHLAAVMTAHGIAIHEEALAAGLLSDLHSDLRDQ